MLDTILNILLIIGAVVWIGCCGVAFNAIRTWNRHQQEQRIRDAVTLGVAGKNAKRGLER